MINVKRMLKLFWTREKWRKVHFVGHEKRDKVVVGNWGWIMVFIPDMVSML